jgi:shikimate kinase
LERGDYFASQALALRSGMTERGQSIVLIGFMGAGKSSTGRALARKTGLALFDTDEIVSRRFGLSVTEIFVQLGEEEFRNAETDALRQLPAAPAAIIVTGGGIVLRPENVKMLHALGRVVSLEADEETLFSRISRRSTRPLLQTQNPRATVAELLRVRAPLYRAAADVQLDTSRLTHDQVADAILKSVAEL